MDNDNLFTLLSEAVALDDERLQRARKAKEIKDWVVMAVVAITLSYVSTFGGSI